MDLRISVIVNSLATRWNFRWQHLMLFGLRMPLMCSTTTDVLRKCHWNIVLVTLSPLPLTTFLSSAMWVRGHNDTSQHVGCIIFLRKHIDKKIEKHFTCWSNCEFILLNVGSYGHNDTSRHATCYTLMYNRQACTFFYWMSYLCDLSFFFRNTLIKK